MQIYIFLKELYPLEYKYLSLENIHIDILGNV
jgi:hypothetical protein